MRKQMRELEEISLAEHEKERMLQAREQNTYTTKKNAEEFLEHLCDERTVGKNRIW